MRRREIFYAPCIWANSGFLEASLTTFLIWEIPNDPNYPDFTDAEQKLVSASLFERYGKLVPFQLADSELQLDAASEELTLCPTIYWAERGAQFVVCKVAVDRYRCQFFYSETEQYGTGHDEYNSLGDCVVTLLQVQSDHERQLANISSGVTRAEIDDDYHGPVMI